MSLMIPEGYRNILGSMENTEKAIKAVKEMFQDNLSAQLAQSDGSYGRDERNGP